MHLKNTYKSIISETRIKENIFFAEIENYTQQTDTITKKIDSRFIQFYFCSKGSIMFHFSEHYQKPLLEERGFVLYNSEKEIPLQLSVASKSKLSIIALHIDKLHRIFAESDTSISLFNTEIQTKFYDEFQISQSLKNVLTQIEQSQFSDKLKPLFLEGKLYEMLVYYFHGKNHDEESCPYLSNNEIMKKLKLAKELILKNYLNPPSTKEIAQEISLQEYRLKEGFKKVYGLSVAKYILDYKLQKSKETLMQGHKTVKQIANELGYENPSHFIDAFKRKYQITPKQFTKQ